MSKEYFEMQILCSLVLMPPKRSPDISKSSRYPWSIPVLQMRGPSRGTDALVHLFYVGFCRSPWPCRGSGSKLLAHGDRVPSQAMFCWRHGTSIMQCVHTWLLTLYKAISFDKLMPRFELPSPPANLVLHVYFWHPLCPAGHPPPKVWALWGWIKSPSVFSLPL